MKWREILPVFTVFGVAACTTYSGPSIDPIEQSLTWFSYVAGEDIRAACRIGGPDRFRFVYNAIFPVQVRGYELTPRPGGAELMVRARGRSGDLSRFSINNPFGPWQSIQGRAELDNERAAQIVDAYAAAIAASPPSAGQRFMSNEYYWIVASCSSGNFSLKGFLHPRVDTNELEFAKLLLAHDNSGVPFRQAARVEGFTRNVFMVQINRAGDGLVGQR
jgi:hypothetical protein